MAIRIASISPIDVDAARDHHVDFAVADEEISLVVEIADVADADPEPRQRLDAAQRALLQPGSGDAALSSDEACDHGGAP